MPDTDQKPPDTFLAENETLDLSDLKDKTFAVAVATGDPEGCKYLCSTLHGPYNFVDMVQEVGDMWLQSQHHSKIIVLGKDIKKPVMMLDANTVDYIECHYIDLIMEETLQGAFDEKKTYTGKAKYVFEEPANKALQSPATT